MNCKQRVFRIFLVLNGNSLLPKKRKIQKGIFAFTTPACLAVVLKNIYFGSVPRGRFAAATVPSRTRRWSSAISFERMAKGKRKRSYGVLTIYQKASEVHFRMSRQTATVLKYKPSHHLVHKTSFSKSCCQTATNVSSIVLQIKEIKRYVALFLVQLDCETTSLGR